MNTSFKTLCMAAFLTWGAASCSTEFDVNDAGNDREVAFTSTTNLKAAGTTWDAGDRIGVYMKTAGTALEGSATAGSTANVAYVTTAGDGRFTASASALYYPHDGSKVDFVAYYPYTTSVTAGSYPVSVADQSVPEAIDLMYADNLKGLDRTSGTGALVFSHQLACVELTLRSTDGTTLDGMKADVADVPTTATFGLNDATFGNLSATADVAMRLSGTGTTLTATALLIPNTSLTQQTKPLRVKLTSADGKVQTVTLADNLPLEKGKTYTYTLNVKNSGGNQSQTVNYIRWTETPTITAEQLADRTLVYNTHYFTDGTKKVRNYSYLYDTDLKMAYWVAYPLCNYYTKKNVDRTEEWAFDPDIDQSLQATMAKGLGNGYDRGHQLPSADRLVTREANEQTFYYTNMTPQVGTLNQRAWATLEDRVRAWSSNIDTLYVVTGAMPSAAGSTSVKYTNDNDGKRIAVPAYYFKALARIDRETGEAYTIAFKFDHATYTGGSLLNAALSVSELEQLTGFTFFPDIAARYKQTYDTTKWPEK